MEAAKIADCCGCALPRAENWRIPLSEAMDAYAISTPMRQAAFLAQVAHESGRLQFVRELWGPTVAQKGYEGRADLGNTHMGDGFKYRGRGLIQTTGRANYARVTKRLQAKFSECPDFEATPEALEVPKWAALSATDFWDDKGLNDMADIGEFMRITRKINGGVNGYAERLSLWEGAKRALGVN
jgi:putative chitinase